MLMDVIRLSLVIKPKNKTKPLLVFETNKIHSQLKKEIKLKDSNVTRALCELEKAMLVKYITGSAKMTGYSNLQTKAKKFVKN